MHKSDLNRLIACRTHRIKIPFNATTQGYFKYDHNVVQLLFCVLIHLFWDNPLLCTLLWVCYVMLQSFSFLKLPYMCKTVPILVLITSHQKCLSLLSSLVVISTLQSPIKTKAHLQRTPIFGNVLAFGNIGLKYWSI